MPEQHKGDFRGPTRVMNLEGVFIFPSNKQKALISYFKLRQECFSPVSTSSWSSELLVDVYIGCMDLGTLKGFYFEFV